MRLCKSALSMFILALATLTGAVAAQDYPAHVIRIIVPISTGSTTDVVARIVAAGMRASIGHAVIVETRPGAGGTVGSALVAREFAAIRALVRVTKIAVNN